MFHYLVVFRMSQATTFIGCTSTEPIEALDRAHLLFNRDLRQNQSLLTQNVARLFGQIHWHRLVLEGSVSDCHHPSPKRSSFYLMISVIHHFWQPGW